LVLNKGNSMRKLLHAATAALLTFVVSACGTLPDAKPFADATSALSVSVKASGQAISDSLRDVSTAVPNDKSTHETQIKKFEAVWANRVKAMQGAVAYSDGIANLIAAANDSQETVNKVGDALAGLAGAAGIPLTAPVVGVALDIGGFIWQRVAIVRASNTLEEAVAAAQPGLDMIATHLTTESDNQLRAILQNSFKSTVTGIRSRYAEEDNFGAQLVQKRSALRGLVAQAPAPGTAASKLDAERLAQLQELDKVHAPVAASLKERDQKIEDAAAAYRARLQLVNALSAATVIWATAHRDLAVAIREKRKVSVSELQETVVALRDIVKKVRAL
jgi:hypothetical protein